MARPRRPAWSAEVVARVADPEGLHAGPCARIARAAESFRSDAWLAADGREVRAISVLELLQLAAPCGTAVTVRAEGPDAEACAAALAAILAGGDGGA